MYCGQDKKNYGLLYKVPSVALYQTWKNKGVLKPEDLKKTLGLSDQFNHVGSPVINTLKAAGILYERGTGTNIMLPQRVDMYNDRYRMSSKRKMGFNVPWIYALTKNDGTFKVHLKGLANRHILTMLLGRATVFAKFLDGPVAEAAKDQSNLSISQESNWY